MSRYDISAFDGSSVYVYSTDNLHYGTVSMDNDALQLSSSGSKILINSGNSLLFKGSSHSIGGASNCSLSIGTSGDVVNLNVSGVTYNMSTITGNISITGSLALKRTGITFNDFSASVNVVKAISGTTDGLDILIQSGRLMILGSGNSGSTASSSGIGLDKKLYLTSDSDINLIANLQNGWSNRKEIKFEASSGNIIIPNKINDVSFQPNKITIGPYIEIDGNAKKISSTDTIEINGVKISASGQVQSSVTNAPPFIVASSTKVDYLNAEAAYSLKDIIGSNTVTYKAADIIRQTPRISGYGIISDMTLSIVPASNQISLPEIEVIYNGAIYSVAAKNIEIPVGSAAFPKWTWVFIPTRDQTISGVADYKRFVPGVYHTGQSGDLYPFSNDIIDPIVLCAVRMDSNTIQASSIKLFPQYPVVKYNMNSRTLNFFEFINEVPYKVAKDNEGYTNGTNGIIKAKAQITDSGNLKLAGGIATNGENVFVNVSGKYESWDTAAGQTHRHTFGYIPSEPVNGSNKSFTIPVSTDYIAVYKNGLRQKKNPNGDYDRSGNTITFNEAPESNSTILVDYIEQGGGS